MPGEGGYRVVVIAKLSGSSARSPSSWWGRGVGGGGGWGVFDIVHIMGGGGREVFDDHW